MVMQHSKNNSIVAVMYRHLDGMGLMVGGGNGNSDGGGGNGDIPQKPT